jgi:Raf kinase inhibitor-like YbhB/YbcL family protein
MKVTCDFANQVIPDAYSKKASVQVKGNAVISFPFDISDLPDGTKSLAWTFVDFDSIPVCGFAYIHWVVANVSPETRHITEDFSRIDKNHTKGKNSFCSKFHSVDFSDIDNGYMGPYPPDKDHFYTLTVYALDQELSLDNDFYMNELYHEMEGHILDQVSIDLIGKC